LQELHQATSLPRPSILRILEALTSLGYVRKGLSDNKYRVTSQVLRLGDSLTAEAQLIEIATPSLDRLCDLLRWPSDLALFDPTLPDSMVVAETSLRQSRFYISRGAAGVRVNILGSAVGIAFLSTQQEDFVGAVLEAARAGSDHTNLSIIASGTVITLVREAQRNGFALRHPLFLGGAYNAEPRNDGLNALAIPLTLEGIPGAAISVTWKILSSPVDEMVRDALPALHAASQEIRNKWEELISQPTEKSRFVQPLESRD
jgi:IclR family mhp operon transcriptional activator